MGANREVMNCGCLCALLGWVDSCYFAMNDVAVNPTFGVGRLIWFVVDDFCVRFVVREHQLISVLTVQHEIAKVGVRCMEALCT